MSETMKAYVLDSFDEQPRITDAPVPSPGPRQLRVRVRTSSVNPVDAAVGRGFFRNMSEYRFPAIQGRDFAGTVDVVGSDVTTFRGGDEVFGMVKRDYIGDGTFAEYVIVDEDRFVAPRPDALDVASAGALGLAGVTALQCLDALDLRPGDTVFINGATGGVGSIAIQIAAAWGLRVIATARRGEDADYARALGATDTVDYSYGDAPTAVRALAPAGVDGVIDLVSRGADAFATIASTATATGIAVTTLSAVPSETSGGPTLINIHSQGDPALLKRVAELVVNGSMRVPLVSAFPFDRIDDAFALLGSGPNGKVGLVLAD